MPKRPARLAEMEKEKAKEEAIRTEKERNELVETIVISIKAHLTGNDNVSYKDILKSKKCELEDLTALLDSFDDLQFKYGALKERESFLNKEITDLKAKRASLGLFAGKEKKRTDADIASAEKELEKVKADAETYDKKLCGYTDKSEISAKEEDIRQKISDLEELIRSSSKTMHLSRQ